ncbi:MAG: pilin [Patescibacteria group bacterium]|nr:pilin [Patescibacteria group bacterium]
MLAISFPNLDSFETQKGYSRSIGPISLQNQISSVLSNVFGFLTVIAGLAFLYFFIIGAVNWITSSGDPKKIEAAKTTITNSLIGLLITLIAFPLIYIFSHLTQIDFTDFQKLIDSFFP